MFVESIVFFYRFLHVVTTGLPVQTLIKSTAGAKCQFLEGETGDTTSCVSY